jgi:hypothetical protein
MQRMQGDVMLEADSFDDNPTHTPKDFRRRFQMNKVMKIVIGPREYDESFLYKKKDCTGPVHCVQVLPDNHRNVWTFY